MELKKANCRKEEAKVRLGGQRAIKEKDGNYRAMKPTASDPATEVFVFEGILSRQNSTLSRVLPVLTKGAYRPLMHIAATWEKTADESDTLPGFHGAKTFFGTAYYGGEQAQHVAAQV